MYYKTPGIISGVFSIELNKIFVIYVVDLFSIYK